MLTGGCCCGAIRYEADGAPFEETICHCSICRRTRASPIPHPAFRATVDHDEPYGPSAARAPG